MALVLADRIYASNPIDVPAGRLQKAPRSTCRLLSTACRDTKKRLPCGTRRHLFGACLMRRCSHNLPFPSNPLTVGIMLQCLVALSQAVYERRNRQGKMRQRMPMRLLALRKKTLQ